ncbi:hypothetical protein M5D96_010129 [Drosophila gunungcola]|uniref:Uncharacterized protein n=1 Tax=Drosophila gunungcola TaxID=103775 RepID=A0A9P9YH20_9MUSC|nr:hypothetical protein M5D96_010129 [Drosophila gunungcola]
MRRTPKLHLVGRAYSEMSPLNPDPLPDTPTTSGAGQDRRVDQSGYGSIFPFGLLRGSFGRGGNPSQAAFKTELSGESLAKMFKSRLKTNPVLCKWELYSRDALLSYQRN